jgi:hypothetical protein
MLEGREEGNEASLALNQAAMDGINEAISDSMRCTG